jgi:hypothetical protein
VRFGDKRTTVERAHLRGKKYTRRSPHYLSPMLIGNRVAAVRRQLIITVHSF